MQRQADLSKFKGNLAYIASLKPVKTTQRDPIKKKRKKGERGWEGRKEREKDSRIASASSQIHKLH